jgi:hypothetical protein
MLFHSYQVFWQMLVIYRTKPFLSDNGNRVLAFFITGENFKFASSTTEEMIAKRNLTGINDRALKR